MANEMLLIDANALIKWMEDNTANSEWMVNQYNADLICSMLEAAPTVDARPVVHGRWIFEQAYENGTADYKCSICDFDDSFPIGNFTYRNYCPNCGSQMEGGDGNG